MKIISEKKILPKQYLGDRSLEYVILDENVEEVGDWAFAHCKKLKKVFLKNPDVRMGKKVFIGCETLENIGFEESDNTLLTGFLMRFMPEKVEINKGEHDWYAKVDRMIKEYIETPDDLGFEGLWTFGEEDYVEKKFDRDVFIEEKKYEKAILAAVRLIENTDSEKIFQNFFQNYIKSFNSVDIIVRYPSLSLKLIELLKRLDVINVGNKSEILSKYSGLSCEERTLILKNDTGTGQEKSFFDLFT